MRLPWHRTRKRWGVTLIELLVVVSILMLLAAVALPMVQPAMESRRVREAARAINIFFGSARNQAIATRRHCGVLLQRTPGKPNAATVLQLVEIPPIYSGNEPNATVTLRLDPSWTGIGYTQLIASMAPGTVSPHSIRRGDLIQVNHQGPWYTIVDDDATGGPIDDTTGEVVVPTTGTPVPDTTFPVRIQMLPGATLPWTGTASPPLPFSIARQPYDDVNRRLNVRRSAGASLTIPGGVAIDLGVSGTETLLGRFWEANPNLAEPVIFIFSPTGSLERVISVVTSAAERQFYATEPVYLLVGRASQVGMPEELPLPSPVPAGWTPPEDARPNWLDPESLWVCLNPQTGLVSVAENAYLPTPPQDASFKWEDRKTWTSKLDLARQFARQVQVNLGGR